jgi:hypothetical protein
VTTDWTTRVRSPAGVKDFSSSLCVQTGSGVHPASCTNSTGGPFPGAKRGRGVTLTTNPHLVPRSRISRSYTSSPPPKRHHGVQRDCFTLLYLISLLYSDTIFLDTKKREWARLASPAVRRKGGSSPNKMLALYLLTTDINQLLYDITGLIVLSYVFKSSLKIRYIQRWYNWWYETQRTTSGRHIHIRVPEWTRHNHIFAYQTRTESQK